MEKQREHRKNSFQNITAVFSVACLAKVSGKLYQYIILILLQILINFFKFQTQIFQWELLLSLLSFWSQALDISIRHLLLI